MSRPSVPRELDDDAELLQAVKELRQLIVRPWSDPTYDRFGHDPRSPYAERFWLPIIGPSALCLMRWFASNLDEHPDGYIIDLLDTARAVGISSRGGIHSAFAHTAARLVQFNMVCLVDHETLLVRTRASTLSKRQAARLPDWLQHEHVALVKRQRQSRPVDELRDRARSLASSLLEAGEDQEAAEKQLHRWKFHPALAFDAVRWAMQQREEQARAGGAALTESEGPFVGPVRPIPLDDARRLAGQRDAPSTAPAGEPEPVTAS